MPTSSSIPRSNSKGSELNSHQQQQQQSTSTATNNNNSSSDPFLAQTLDIPLTQQDRQEGYDVELLRSQPRGITSSTSSTGGLASPPLNSNTSNNNINNELIGRESLEAGTGVGAYEKIPLTSGSSVIGSTTGVNNVNGDNNNNYSTSKELDSNLPLELSTAAVVKEEPFQNQSRKKWYLRPLSLIIIGLIVLAVALAIGLGVGLGKKNDNSTTNSTTSNSTSNSTTARASLSTSIISSASKTTTHYSLNITSHATIGTVIPNTVSILDSPAYTPISNSATLTAPPLTTSTIMGASLVGVGAPNPNSNTHTATTGNIPIPESVSGVFSGVYVSALTSGGGGMKRHLVRETGVSKVKKSKKKRGKRA